MIIPRAALALGLAGLIPFLYGAAAIVFPALALAEYPARAILEIYGAVIFCFMAGCLWGFAAKDGRDLWRWLGLSVIPAILIFFAILRFGRDSTAIMTVAFPALLILDVAFARAGLAPAWWMQLRILLTIVVTTCLAIGSFA